MNKLEELKSKIFANPQNQTLFELFDLDASEDELENRLGLTQNFAGEETFFEDFAKNLPEETKYLLGGYYSILVNEETGLIFAIHFRHFVFIFRCDFERNGIENTDEQRIGEPDEEFLDIRKLGENWAILNFFDNKSEQLEWGYELTKN